jgi:leucyl aminopeptidase (aminopeptidase T)
MGLVRGARIAVNACMGVKRGEKVLIVTDPQRARVGQALFKVSEKVGARVLMVLMQTLQRHGQEPPKPVAELMERADVVFAPTTYSLTHTQARLRATRAGARIASMPMITERMMGRGGMLANYREVEKLTRRVARRLDRAQKVRITTRKGTDLEFSVRGRRAHPDTGLFHKPGDFGNLPAGEAFIAPVEGTGEGEVLVDGSMVDVLKGTIRMKFENGKATEIRGSKKLVRMLDESEPHSRSLAEFGIGTNPKARLIGNVLEDEKVLGTCHIALGDNSTFGGRIRAGIHVDGIILKPTVKLDGKILMENGRLKI